jgi:mannose-6-phosphate isomerase-like protein (cupin superfamily)
MMGNLRRRLVMTGHDARGVSRVASDRMIGGSPGPSLPGSEIGEIWGADEPLAFPDTGTMPGCAGFFPPLHGARLVEICLPAEAVDYVPGSKQGHARHEAGDGPAQAGAALADDSRPGMHRTRTTDIIIVMEGRLDCQLDEETVHLKAGDVFIQNGTIHAWFNPYPEPCRYMAVILGAENSLCP